MEGVWVFSEGGKAPDDRPGMNAPFHFCLNPERREGGFVLIDLQIRFNRLFDRLHQFVVHVVVVIFYIKDDHFFVPRFPGKIVQ